MRLMILMSALALIRIFFRVGIELPAVEIRYDHLSINADVFIGSRALPTLFNFARDIVEVSTGGICENISLPKKRYIEDL